MSDRVHLLSIIDMLKQRKSNICCTELSKLLTEHGFEVKDGKLGGHKVVTHDYIEGFLSTSFNCGHGKNPQIKPIYISKLRKVIEQYIDDIDAYLKR